MSTPMKWFFASMFFLIAVLVIVYAALTQNITVQTTSDVDGLEEVLNVGSIRGEITEDGEVDVKHFDKDELVANILAEVTKVQKDTGYDVKVDYVFFDGNENVTENEEDIRSVQLRVQHIDNKGKVRGSAEKRLAINQLEE